jgi:hypothetical protein
MEGCATAETNGAVDSELISNSIVTCFGITTKFPRADTT